MTNIGAIAAGGTIGAVLRCGLDRHHGREAYGRSGTMLEGEFKPGPILTWLPKSNLEE